MTSYQYDSLDRLTRVTYADGSTTAYTYDAGDRVTQIADSVGSTGWKHGAEEMTNDIREIDLGRDGVDYLRTCLLEGKELARELLATVDFVAGRVCTFLPVSVSSEEARQFTTGGKLPPAGASPGLPRMPPMFSNGTAIPRPNTDDVLISAVLSHLDSSPDAVCVFEDQISEPADRAMRGVTVRWVSVANAVYYVLASTDAGKVSTVGETIRRARSIWPPLLGVLSSLPAYESRNRGQARFDRAGLREVANRASHVVVGAYDGEGFLLWSRTR